MEVLNLENLPDEAKREVIQFYNNLLMKYKAKDDLTKWKFNRDELHDERFDNSKLGKKLRLKEYFGKFQFKPIKFDREEANAR